MKRPPDIVKTFCRQGSYCEGFQEKLSWGRYRSFCEDLKRRRQECIAKCPK